MSGWVRAVETRVIRWTAPGYEESYTQYAVLEDGRLAVSQVALRDNMARAMGGLPTITDCGSVERAKEVAEMLIANRLDSAEEVTP